MKLTDILSFFMPYKKPGHIFFISGPSGVGKGTVINGLRENHSAFVFPPSCTTRDPRPGEVEGETYYFISKEEFEAKIEAGEFLEYAQVHGGNYYGTLRDPIVGNAEKGKVVIREFDVQGFSQARERLPRELFTSIFLRPQNDDFDELVRRIKERAPISDEEVKKRVDSMKKEIDKADIYDHQVISIDGETERLYREVAVIVLEKS